MARMTTSILTYKDGKVTETDDARKVNRTAHVPSSDMMASAPVAAIKTNDEKILEKFIQDKINLNDDISPSIVSYDLTDEKYNLNYVIKVLNKIMKDSSPEIPVYIKDKKGFALINRIKFDGSVCSIEIVGANKKK